MIGGEETLLLLRREMANLNDRMHMLRGNRRLIGGIGDLRDEAAILAGGLGEALPHPGGTTVEDIAQDGLVGRNQALRIFRSGLRAHSALPE